MRVVRTELFPYGVTKTMQWGLAETTVGTAVTGQFDLAGTDAVRGSGGVPRSDGDVSPRHTDCRGKEVL